MTTDSGVLCAAQVTFEFANNELESWGTQLTLGVTSAEQSSELLEWLHYRAGSPGLPQLALYTVE